MENNSGAIWEEGVGLVRDAPQLKLTVISEYQSDGEMTKLT